MVRTDRRGQPLMVRGQAIEAVRESWLVQDRWWTEHPLSRRYWELVSIAGADLVVFHDLHGGGWFIQR
ncbi:MAG TPA: hypothetical protein VGN69_08765 [Solirubrobacteraceae bacterium]|nr:hypothetical protein [Solirubrobacteraceae bacterium]